MTTYGISNASSRVTTSQQLSIAQPSTSFPTANPSTSSPTASMMPAARGDGARLDPTSDGSMPSARDARSSTQLLRSSPPTALQARRCALSPTAPALASRQQNGEISADIDPAALSLILIGAIAAPALMPHVVHRLFGADALSDEFRQRYEAGLRAMIAHLTR